MRDLADKATKYIEQSAAIPYRQGKRGLEVLLVTSVRTRRWVLPKGMVASGMAEWESARKEAFEEAGIKGKIEKNEIGAYSYSKPDDGTNASYRVRLFPMMVSQELDDWPEKNQRKRKWMAIDEAADAVDEKKLSKMLRGFKPSNG